MANNCWNLYFCRGLYNVVCVEKYKQTQNQTKNMVHKNGLKSKMLNSCHLWNFVYFKKRFVLFSSSSIYLEFLSGNLKTRNFFFPIKMHPFASSLFFLEMRKKGSASTRIRTPDLPLYSSLSMPQDHEVKLWNMGKSCIHELVK